MTFCSEKNSIFSAQFSDDLFLVIDQVFGFPLSFPEFSASFAMFNVAYDPFLTRTTAISEKFLCDTFYSALAFARIRQHYFSKYWEHGCIGRPPTSNILGAVPPAPIGLRLCSRLSR